MANVLIKMLKQTLAVREDGVSAAKAGAWAVAMVLSEIKRESTQTVPFGEYQLRKTFKLYRDTLIAPAREINQVDLFGWMRPL